MHTDCISISQHCLHLRGVKINNIFTKNISIAFTWFSWKWLHATLQWWSLLLYFRQLTFMVRSSICRFSISSLFDISTFYDSKHSSFECVCLFVENLNTRQVALINPLQIKLTKTEMIFVYFHYFHTTNIFLFDYFSHADRMSLILMTSKDTYW
jgi:hypothetical protein